MTDTLTTSDTQETRASPSEIARWIQAFNECNQEIQDIVLEMSEIVADSNSTTDEKIVAFDAMMDGLFPGTSADVLEDYHQQLKTPESVKAAEELRGEEKAFADNLRIYMNRKNVTQEQLAHAAGISQPAVSNILNRRCRPQRRTVVRFAEALEVSPDELWQDFSKQA